jgi:hypothetical protein
MASMGGVCAPLVILPALVAALEAQSTLEITSPANGTVVYPGHVLGVTVSVSGPPLENVTVIGWDPIGFTKILNAQPYQFDVEIPAKMTPGPYLLTAMGTSHSGPPVDSEPITIDVERPDQPVKITANHPQLGLNVGDRLGIQVTGTYADGSVVDLSKSTQTTFVSQAPAIATVTAEGLVTAVAPGSTAIVIDGRISVPVTVEQLIRIIPTSATLKASETREFVARVTKPPNGKVTWILSPNVGSVVDGLYTAPSRITSDQEVTLTASSVDDPALSVSAVIQLSAAATIDVVPGWAVLYMNQTKQFKATTANAGGQDLKWSISPKGAGTIDANGLYTAPAAIAATQKVTVTATSAANPAISGSTAIYISPRPFVIFPFPPDLHLAPGGTVSSMVTQLATDRFLHPIALTVAGAPIGIRTTLSKATLIGNGQASLTFTYENQTVPGDYPITVTAQDTVYPVLMDSKTVTLHVGGGAH